MCSPVFTWESRGIAKKLNWCFGNAIWKNTFPESFVDHLGKQKLDHRPILTFLNNSKQLRFKPFKFQSYWVLDNRFAELVSNNWLSDVELVPALKNLIARI